MAIRYLLDTNTVSYIIRGNFPAVREHLVNVPVPDVAVSASTEAELHHGVARLGQSQLEKLVTEFLLRLTILPWDSTSAQEYGRLRADLEREGQPMGNLDLMFAAQAMALDLILVTNDQAFQRIKRLRIENWTNP